MEPALGIPWEPEPFEDRTRLPHDLLSDELPDPDHLVAVVRVGDDVAVLSKYVEHGEAVRRERSDATTRLFLVQRVLAFESLLAERQRRTPHALEVLADDEL